MAISMAWVSDDHILVEWLTTVIGHRVLFFIVLPSFQIWPIFRCHVGLRLYNFCSPRNDCFTMMGHDCKVGISNALRSVLDGLWQKCLACCRSAKIKSHGKTQTDQHATHLIGKRIARNVGLEPIRIWFQLPRNVVNSRNHAQVITICYGCEFQ